MMANSEAWYVVKQSDGHCEVIRLDPNGSNRSQIENSTQKWGPFDSQGEAIARRVGLIRSGRCQPL